MARTSAFGSVVRKPNRSFVVSPSLTLRTDVQRVHRPAKNANGRLSSKASHSGGREPSGKTSFSENEVNGTTQRLSTPIQLESALASPALTEVSPGVRSKGRKTRRRQLRE